MKFAIYCPECKKNLTFFGSRGQAERLQCKHCGTWFRMVSVKGSNFSIELKAFGTCAFLIVIVLSFSKLLHWSRQPLSKLGVALLWILMISLVIWIHHLFIANYAEAKKIGDVKKDDSNVGD